MGDTEEQSDALRSEIKCLERSIRLKETQLELRRKMCDEGTSDNTDSQQVASSREAKWRTVWKPAVAHIHREATMQDLREQVARIAGFSEQDLRLYRHVPGEERREIVSVDDALLCEGVATLEATQMASVEEEDEVLVDGGTFASNPLGEPGQEEIPFWIETRILVRRPWTFEQLKMALGQLTGIPAYLMRIHNGPPNANAGEFSPQNRDKSNRVEFLNMEQVWKTSVVVFWVSQISLTGAGVKSTSAERAEKRAVLVGLVEESERDRTEGQQRLEQVERDLTEAVRAYNDERDRRERLIRTLRSETERLQSMVRERATICADHLEKETGSREATGVNASAFLALDTIQGLTRSREEDIRHGERELRELRTLNDMKRRKQSELREEYARKLEEVRAEGERTVQQVRSKIDQERADIEARRDTLQRDHDELCERLKWNNQLWHSKDQTCSLGSDPPRRRSQTAREKLARDAERGSPHRSPARVSQPGVAAWNRQEGNVVSGQTTGTIAVAKGPQASASPEGAVRNTVALSSLQQAKDLQRSKLRRLELEISASSRMCARRKTEASAQLREARKGAENAEREAAQLEEQSEYLAAQLRQMRGGAASP
eukprot:Hpha_TRINITY_DN16509_c1_g8::TRINITY_DN16509_c1_g8_i1::g.135366::m.135366